MGKTTTCPALSDAYLNWDNSDDRRRLLRGPAALAEAIELDRLHARPPVAALDALHTYPKWKSLLKGFVDTYGDRARILVTGSSRLDVFRRGGDSLMGRYLLYRMHPWSVGECLHFKAEIQSHRPEPVSSGNQSPHKAAAPSLHEEILACLDQAASLLIGKHAAALKALESARNLVVSLR